MTKRSSNTKSGFARRGALLGLCVAAAMSVPGSAAANWLFKSEKKTGKSPLAGAIEACMHADSLDQKLLHEKLTAMGWRAVASEAEIQSLDFYAGLVGLSWLETGFLSPYKVKKTVRNFTQAQAEKPEEIMLAIADGMGLYTHASYGDTLLRSYKRPKNQHVCLVALDHAAHDDQFLYQLRVGIQVSTDQPGTTYEVKPLADGMEINRYELKADVKLPITQVDTTKIGNAIGTVRLRMIAPAKASREAFRDVFKARGFLSVRFIAR